MVAYVITATPNTTTATAAAMRPHGLRCWVTTCVGGRVRPLPPPGRAAVRVAAVLVPERAAPPPDGLPGPPRGARLSSGLRSLAKATPRYGARGRAPCRASAPSSERQSRSASCACRGGGRQARDGATDATGRLSTLDG